ncbi:MAG: hypothetical protein AB7O26_18925 [Planctomycetaceae bacterium]
MTWKTEIGERILLGAESILIRNAMLTMVDLVEDDFANGSVQWEFGVDLFDLLSPAARLAMLAQVGWALLRQTEVCPPLTAINEAAVAAIYAHLNQEIQFEIDSEGELPDPTFWRRQVLTVFHELGDTEELPTSNCVDVTEWDLLLEILSQRVLWDGDFNDADLYVDLPPEHAKIVMSHMTIDESYYTAVAPDPRDSDMPKVRSRLKELLQTK